MKIWANYFYPSGWTLDQVTWTKMAKNLLHLWMMLLTKHPKPMIFHWFSLQTRRLLRVWTALWGNWPRSYAVANYVTWKLLHLGWFPNMIHCIHTPAAQTGKRGSCRRDIVRDKWIFRRDMREKTLARDVHSDCFSLKSYWDVKTSFPKALMNKTYWKSKIVSHKL